jgi:hypothetical protein
MTNTTGLKGPSMAIKDEWEIEYKTLYEQLKNKKVLTEEIWQERANPLIPPDGIIEEDLEIIQYLGNEKQKENEGVKQDLKLSDARSFKRARKDVLYKPEDFLTVKILPSKRATAKPLEALKKCIKIKKIADS